MQHAVEQCYIGPRQNRQMQIRKCCRVGATRIDHNDFQLQIFFFCGFNTAKQNRMGISRVRTGDENQIGVIDVFVAARRRIGAQRGFVAGHGGRHAQARIGVDVVGADETFGEFVEDVIIFRQQLPGDIKRHAVGTVFCYGFGKTPRQEIQGRIPIAPDARRGPVRAHFWVERTTVWLCREMQS